MNPKRIDQENLNFYNDIIDDVHQGKLTIKDILGFNIEGASVFIPRVPCANINPTEKTCKSAEEGVGSTSVFSLAPIYDSLIYPIDKGFLKEPLNENTFRKLNNISIDDFLVFVEKKRIIPYFSDSYQTYNEDFITRFLEPGLPRISRFHLNLILRKNACSVVNGDCKRCNNYYGLAKTDISAIRTNPDDAILNDCSSCLQALYTLGINRETLLKSHETAHTICALRDIIISRNMNAVVKSNCIIARNALGIISGSTNTNQALDYIVKGLKVSYSPEIDIASYLDFLDGKTTRAVREIIKRIMEDPYAMKYSDRLSAKLCDLNKEIEEIGKTRTAKFYQAVSDIAVYGGSKYLEAKSGSLIKVQKEEVHKTSEWLASKLFDIHAKVTGKDWTLAQIYKTRTKIEKYRAASKRIEQ